MSNPSVKSNFPIHHTIWVKNQDSNKWDSVMVTVNSNDRDVLELAREIWDILEASGKELNARP